MDPLLAVQELLALLLIQDKDDKVEIAWRSKFDPSTIFIRFKFTEYCDEVLRCRGRLKGSDIMMHEDLIALRIRQLERRQEDGDKPVERLKKARLKSKE